jgi:hypothetical protein
MATLFETAMRGYDAADEMIKEGRAYKAAREEHGEVASDPGLFSAIQDIELAKKVDSRADENLKIQQRAADRADAKEGRDARADNQTFGANETALEEDGVLNLVQGLRQARDNDQDLGEAFDALAEGLPNLGVDPADIPAMREQLVENPEILDAYYEALTKDTGRAGRAGAVKEVEDNAVGMQKLGDVISRIDLLESDEFSQAGPTVFGIPSPSDVLQGGFGQFGTWPSSKAADFVFNLENLAADVRSNAFETLKGGGQITEAESKFAADAIAALSRSTSYGEFQRELRRLRAYMAALKDAANGRINGAATETVPWDDGAEVKRGTDEDPNYTRKNGTGIRQIYPGFIDPDSGAKFNGGDPGAADSWTMPE